MPIVTEPDAERRALWAVTAVAAVAFLGYGILIPIVPLYAREFGASEFVVGLLIASFALAQFAFAPALGRVSDRYGRRRVLLATIGCNAAGYVLFGLADSLVGLFAARLLSGAASANVAVAQAYVADALDDDERARGFGLLGAAFGVGLTFGPALGGVVSGDAAVAAARTLVPVLADELTAYSLPGFVTAALAAGNFLLAFAALPEPAADDADDGTAADVRSAAARLRDDRPVLELVAAYGIRSLAYACMTSMFVVFTADVYGFGPTRNGYVLGVVGVVVAATQGVVVGRVLDDVDPRRAVGVSAAVEAVCLGLLPLAPLVDATAFGGRAASVAALLAAVGLLACSDAFTTVGLTTALSRASGDRRQGERLGVAQSGDGLARAVGPALAGALYSTIGYWAPFAAGALAMTLVVPLALRRAASASTGDASAA